MTIATDDSRPVSLDSKPILITFRAAWECIDGHFGTSKNCLCRREFDRIQILATSAFQAEEIWLTRDQPTSDYYARRTQLRSFRSGVFLTIGEQRHILPDLTFADFQRALLNGKRQDNGLIDVDLSRIQIANEGDPEFPVRRLRTCGHERYFTHPR